MFCCVVINMLVEYSLVVHDKLPSTGIIVYYSLVLGKLSTRVYHKVQAWCALSPSLALEAISSSSTKVGVRPVSQVSAHERGQTCWLVWKSHLTAILCWRHDVKQNDRRSSCCMWSGAGSLCFNHTVCKWSHDGDMLVSDLGASLGSIIEEALWGLNLMWN